MSADHQLLELAAKAAGYKFDSTNPFEIAEEHKGGTNWIEWNPLIDDGDALRLAVKLFLDIRGSMASGALRYVSQRGSTYAEMNADSCAATRRAIVRAAAEIGKRMS